MRTDRTNPAPHQHKWLILLAACVGTVCAAALAVALAPDPGASAPASGAVASPGTLLSASGHGDATPPAFVTAPDWVLTSTYSCAAGGTLRVLMSDPGHGFLPLLDAAGSGTATVHEYQGRGPHAVRVASTCAWTLTVADAP